MPEVESCDLVTLCTGTVCTEAPIVRGKIAGAKNKRVIQVE